MSLIQTGTVTVTVFDHGTVNVGVFASLKAALAYHLSETSAFAGGGFGSEKHLVELQEMSRLIDKTIGEVRRELAAEKASK